ncbi:hypothetical protein HPP92_009370 [Vanilla planifolia]|uniref:SOSEKI DIX-like domain-containing protein n=1 Tax=Vanilla planifolia TaxID=51239 RepID=A0A835RFQ9_VANPL|nr:hypothetical protein HPP92_009601 [Vanilla planifolia]KAG0487275.1 hypothetical protein HPP92_009370 [Vanilla planifolia]
MANDIMWATSMATQKDNLSSNLMESIAFNLRISMEANTLGMETGRGGRGEVRRIHVVYFLCRNGKAEHPHLIRVHHLHRRGVRLRDVKRWLSELRGQDMADSFAWSYKRRYRAGYVWQDLTDDDLITPISDNEYVLKGSLLPPLCTAVEQDKDMVAAEVKVPLEAEQREDERSDTEEKSRARGEEKMPIEEVLKRVSDELVRIHSGHETIESATQRPPATVIRNLIGCMAVETMASFRRSSCKKESGQPKPGKQNSPWNSLRSSLKPRKETRRGSNLGQADNSEPTCV